MSGSTIYLSIVLFRTRYRNITCVFFFFIGKKRSVKKALKIQELYFCLTNAFIVKTQSFSHTNGTTVKRFSSEIQYKDVVRSLKRGEFNGLKSERTK